MPPRKTARRSAPSPLPIDNAPLLAASSANTVYNVPEIMLRILRSLEKKDLAVMMRVNRQKMALVAGELYHTMSYNHVRFKMAVSTPRRQMYCDQIKVIDATSLSITPTMVQQLGLDADPAFPSEGRSRQAYLDRWVKTYHPELIEILVPPLRKKCSSLRKIILGSTRGMLGGDRWVVDLGPHHPVGLRTSGSSSTVSPSTGHIQHIQTLRYLLNAVPPARLINASLPPPSQQYTLQSRFDLKLSSSSPKLTPIIVDQWATVLEDDPQFASLHQAVDFGPLPITMQHITALYQRQADAGHQDRLCYIAASHIVPWTLSDLRALGIVASASLSCLILARPDRKSKGCYNSLIWSRQLYRLIRIVTKSLPNLIELHFRLRSGRAAEAFLQDRLRSHTLRSSGTIKILRVYTVAVHVPAFNTLRYLSRLVTNDASIMLGVRDKESPEQTKFLNYVKTRVAAQRGHLATARFADLGVYSLMDVFNLEYDARGRPLHLLTTQSAQWAQAEAVLRVTPASTTIGAPVLSEEEMDQQLVAVDQIEEAAGRMERILAATRRKGLDIRAAIQQKRSQNGGGSK